MCLPFFSERGQEGVDGVIDGPMDIVGKQKPSVFDGHVLFGWNKVHDVGFDLHPVLRLKHHHAGVFAENLGHQAFVVGRKMLDDNERQSAVVRHSGKELLKCFQAAGGRSYTHDKRQGHLLPA